MTPEQALKRVRFHACWISDRELSEALTIVADLASGEFAQWLASIPVDDEPFTAEDVTDVAAAKSETSLPWVAGEPASLHVAEECLSKEAAAAGVIRDGHETASSRQEES